MSVLCEQLENELISCLQNQRGVLRSALDILHTYATIIGHFGLLFAEKSRTSHYLNWLQCLLMDFTSDKCSEIVDEFDEVYRKLCTSSVAVQPVLNIELKLQTIITNTNTRLIKLMDRRSLDVTDTPQLEILMEQATCLIKTFIQENQNEGRKSLTAVIVTALCSLNKRYLLMESAADAAGDRLMDLTSRDGDWFLDELCSMSGNVTQLLEILVENSMTTEMNIHQLHSALTSTHKVYIALHELNVNFRNIIIPEALKTIQGGEESVHVALKHLSEMILNTSCSLDQLSSQIEVLHRNVVMGIENNNTDAQNTVQQLQNQFNDLLKIPDSEPTDLSPGQMLLMAFNGLFIKLETEFAGLMEATELVNVADNWRNVDLIKEAKAYQLSSFTSDTRGLMSRYFFVKRLQAMQEFFQMCQQFSSVLENSSGNLCFDDEQLSKPIKKFIAAYVRKQVIGFPSQILGYIICVYINSMGLDVSAEIDLKDVGAESKVPLDDMCKKAVDACLKNGQFKLIQFTQASSLTSSQETTWRKHDLARRLDENIVLVKGSLQRVQFQLARYQWLHEDIFTNARGHHSQMVMPNRASIMSEMRKSMSSLLTQENNLVCCMERYNQLESSITQRLRWAAGANPSLNLVLTQFEEESAGRKTLYDLESKLASDVTSMCQGILHFEAFRTRTPEALTSDSNFMNLINRCRESCVLAESTASSVTALEEELMLTKPPSDGKTIDENYISSTRDVLVEDIKEIKSKYLRLKESLDVTKEILTNQVVNIKSIVTAHHKLMSEIRTILKSVAKLEEQDHGFTPQPGSIRDYLSTYKTFSETLTMALKLAVSEDVSKSDMDESEKMIDSLVNQTAGIYDKLVSFAPPLLTEKDNEDDENAPMNFVSALKKPSEKDPTLLKKLPPLGKDVHTGTPPPPGALQAGVGIKSGMGGVKKIERVSRDPRTGKAIQERNSYAVSVWRRVKMKLDGRDPDPNKRLTIQEQVDFVLKEATDQDNLAVLYEGWTPWV